MPAYREAYLLIKEWMAAHPGVQVQFEPKPQDTKGLFQTQMVAGTLPDLISWSVGVAPDVIAPNIDLFYDWAKELKEKNPYGYMPTWEEEFPLGTKITNLWAPWVGESRRLFLGNTQTGGFGYTAHIYNADMLKKADAQVPPKTWSELIAMCEKLLKAGFTPMFMQTMQFQWEVRVLCDQFLELTFNQILSAWNAQAFTQEIWAWAIKNGIVKATDPRLLEALRLMKDMVKFWIRDWTAPENVNYFLLKRVALQHDGFWNIEGIRDAPQRDFEVGTFYMPPVDKAVSEYATGVAIRRLGTAEAGSSLAAYVAPMDIVKRGTYPLVKDLLQYVSARKQNEKWCAAQTPPCLPPGKKLEDTLKDPKELAVHYGFFNPEMTAARMARDIHWSGIMDVLSRLFVDYSVGKLGLEEYGKQMQDEWVRITDKRITDNPTWKVKEWPKP